MRRRILPIASLIAVATIVAATFALRGDAISLEGCQSVDRLPRISPDYSGAVIPPNIAPLRFVVREPGQRYCVDIRGTGHEGFRVTSRDGRIMIPEASWAELLVASRGGTVTFLVHVEDADGTWRRFREVTNTVATDAIDSHLVYRRIRALFNTWGTFGIYQRNLGSYDAQLVVSNEETGEGCINCHTFRANDPGDMMLHTRGGAAGSSTILTRGGEAAKVDTKSPFGLTGYTSWHPDGRMLVCAVVKVRQFFHTARSETRDVIDLDSTLVYYLPDEDRVAWDSNLSHKDRLESYPCWAPDGKTLYFCSAEKLWPDDGPFPPTRYNEVRYDLVRISYDAATGRWGQPETVLASADTGMSITQPRVSPDGKRLLFCMADYGCFPIFQREADLYMLDLETGQHEKLGVNSDEADTWHSWSSNGRWIVFSSKRGNGLFARPYISYVDAEGKVHKPLAVPQEDPTHYDSCIMTYNVPELVRGPVPVPPQELTRLICSEIDPGTKPVVTGASVKAPRKPPTEKADNP